MKRTSRSTGRLPRPLALFLALLLLLAFGSWGDAALGYLHAGKAGLAYLWMTYPAFDFVAYTLQFPYLHTTRFFTLPVMRWVYPAPAILVLYPFFKVASATNRIIGFVVFAGVTLAANLAVAWRFSRALGRRGLSQRQSAALVAALAIFGWPLYFALQRGNLEALLWIGTAAGVLCFVRGRFTAAAVLFGAFGSVKLYPLLFLALLLRPRRFLDIAIGLSVAVTSTLIALRVLNPDILYAWQQTVFGIRYWTVITTSAFPPMGMGVDHSMLSLLRQCTHGSILDHPHALNWYLGISAILATVLFLGRALFLPRPNQVLFIACAAVLLPPTSYDYTLVTVLIPCGWIILLCIEHARAGQDLRPFFAPFGFFAVALGTLSFLHTHAGAITYFEGPVRTLALLALLGSALLVPLEENVSALHTASRPRPALRTAGILVRRAGRFRPTHNHQSKRPQNVIRST